MRREAVNTFNEGLIMDLNPLTTPSNVMTSCLNGTIITYNGNEFVLQNDMGNGRVETAYLPSGYVPVGLKEFGGIVYVASYNPLTNKSQIGSFPSPERNISSNEISPIVREISPSQFSEDQLINKLNLFKDNDTVIRSGDKFSIIIASDDVSEPLEKYISNYNNTINDKDGYPIQVKSPKNKLLTIKVCILDANNNLIDITSDLKRVNTSNGKLIDFKDNTSDLIKCNTGYFALKDQISEQQGDENASITALNVYNNKTFGSLYVVATLNTIDRIEVAISGRNNLDYSSYNAYLKVTITYYYNCPDGYYSNNISSPNYKYLYGNEDDYASDSLKVIEECEFKFGDTVIDHFIFNKDNAKQPEYIESENLYKLEETYEVNDIKIKGSPDIREYAIVPCMSYMGERIALQGLRVTGNIDLANLGNGQINLNTWKYYCTESTITLTWGFDANLREGQEIKELHFDFYDLEDLDKNPFTYQPTLKYNYNGVFTDVIDYNRLQYGKIYLVKIQYTTQQPDMSPTVISIYRWLVTTNLYNEQYFKISDYINLDHKLNNIDLDVNVTLNNNSSYPGSRIESYAPNLNSTEEQLVLGYKSNSKVFNLNSTIQVYQENKYPFKINKNAYSVNYELLNDAALQWNGSIEGDPTLPDFIGELSTNSNDATNPSIYKNAVNVSINNNQLNINYKLVSYLKGQKLTTTKPILCTRVLSSYGSRISDLLPNEDGLPAYSIQVVFRVEYKSGPRDLHGYGVFVKKRNGRSWDFIQKPGNSTKYKTDKKDGTIIYKFKDQWDSYITENVRDVLNYNPIILFIDQNTFNVSLGDSFYTNSGGIKLKGSAANEYIGNIALWFNGDTYVMIPSINTGQRAKSIDKVLKEDLYNIYVRQNDNRKLNGYLIDPDRTSYVQGGNASINFSLEVTLNNSSNPIPDYLANEELLQSRINTIIQDETTSFRLAKQMTFSVNNPNSLVMPISVEDQLVSMRSVYSQIRNLFDNPTLTEPLILQESNGIFSIHQHDTNGNAIDEFEFYTIENNKPQLLQESALSTYYDNLKLIKLQDEYHLIPKIPDSTLTPLLYGTAGNDDAHSELDFSQLKVFKLKIGNTPLYE